MPALREQLRRHSVALISLVVALTSLAYNTWRNEQTEANRNVRTAGVEMLRVLGQLERVRFFLVYDPERANAREGWAHVLTARDLAELTGEPAHAAVQVLFVTWQENWQGLSDANAAGGLADNSISAAIDDARAATLEVLANLD